MYRMNKAPSYAPRVVFAAAWSSKVMLGYAMLLFAAQQHTFANARQLQSEAVTTSPSITCRYFDGVFVPDGNSPSTHTSEMHICEDYGIDAIGVSFEKSVFDFMNSKLILSVEAGHDDSDELRDDAVNVTLYDSAAIVAAGGVDTAMNDRELKAYFSDTGSVGLTEYVSSTAAAQTNAIQGRFKPSDGNLSSLIEDPSLKMPNRTCNNWKLKCVEGANANHAGVHSWTLVLCGKTYRYRTIRARSFTSTLITG